MGNPIEDRKDNAITRLLESLPKNLQTKVINGTIFVCVILALGNQISNFNGVASDFCSVHLLKATCSSIDSWIYGSADDANDTPALQAIIGTWGLPGRSGEPACHNLLVYSVEQKGYDQFVHVQAPDFDSIARIVATHGMSLFTRTVSPQSDAGHQWELRLESDRLVQVDANNTPTILVRCITK